MSYLIIKDAFEDDQYVDYRKELKEAFENNAGASTVTVLTDKDFNSYKSAEITLKKLGGSEPWTIEEKKNGRFRIVQRFTSDKSVWQMNNEGHRIFLKQDELGKTDLRNRKFTIEQAIKAGLPVPDNVRKEFNL